MLTLTVGTLVEVTGGELLSGSQDAVINGVVVDSRVVDLGAAFVALPGEHVDGHDFVRQALERGARALIVTDSSRLGDLDEELRLRGAAVVRVANCMDAIQALASYQRGRLHCPVVGVTGSTGKTTTKDLIDAVLATQMRVVSTSGNRNNELGVPLTILEAGADTDALVLEMGMRGAGQIAELARIARPTIGLVTNIGQTHIELLGSETAIADAKAELVRAIPPDGAVFLNGDDAHSDHLAEQTDAHVTFYGLTQHCQVRAEDIEVDEESHPRFVLVTPDVRAEVYLQIPGRHNVYNALAAAAVGFELGLSAEQVVAGLERATAGDMRMQVFCTASGVTVVNDAYNANPTSMRAALDTLAEMQTPGRRVAVLGDMAELGSLTELAHFRIGEHVAELPIDVLLTVGPRAKRIADAAKAGGFDPAKTHVVESADQAAAVLATQVDAGDIVLVKASRVMGLERVVERIVGA